MDTEERTKLIAQYRDGYAAIAEALLKITPEELDARPAPNKWTTREIIHHLADSETTSAVRLRRLLAEDQPRDSGIRPGRVRAAAALRAPARERARAVSLRAIGHGGTAGVPRASRLVARRDAQRKRPLTVEDWLRIYAEHAHKHARQILVARAAARK